MSSTFQAPKRVFLVPNAPKTPAVCSRHKLGRGLWLVICTRESARTRCFACGRITNNTEPHARSVPAVSWRSGLEPHSFDTSDTPQRRENGLGFDREEIEKLRTLHFVRKHLAVSWLVGCLAWQVASARREVHQHHRTIRRQTKAKLRLSVTPHGPRRPRKGSSRAVSVRFVLQSDVGTPTHDGRSHRPVASGTNTTGQSDDEPKRNFACQ